MSTLFTNDEGVAHAGATPRWETPRAAVGWYTNAAVVALTAGVWSAITYGGAPTLWTNQRGFILAAFDAARPRIGIYWPGLYRISLDTTWSTNGNFGEQNIRHCILLVAGAVPFVGTYAAQGTVIAVGSTRLSLSSSDVVMLARGDFLQAEASIGAGGPLNYICSKLNMQAEFLDIA